MPAIRAIVGRDAELEQLRRLARGEARPLVAFIEGDAGVGKTALLEAVAAEAAEDGAIVLRARATASEAGSSYAALDDLLRPALDGLERLPAPQRRALAAALLLEDADAPIDPRLVGLACRSLLAALPGRILVAVDDWQWLDAASAAALAFVLRRLEPEGASMIATVRSGEADDALAALVRALPAGQALELALEPLEPGELGRVLQARAGQVALEMVRAPGAATATDIRRLLARRLAALSPEARRLLRYAAAQAEPTADTVGAAGALDEVIAADVLVLDGARLRFTHPLIAAVVEERAAPAEWRAIHAELAERAEGQEPRARHLAAAASGPDEAVASALAGAAAQADARGATMAAAELAVRAAEMTPEDDAPRRLERLLAAADAAMGVADGPQTRRLLEEVLARADSGPARADALHKLAYTVSDDSAMQLIESALEEAGEDEALRCDIELSAALFAVMTGQPEQARRHAESAARRAEATGVQFLLSQALSNLAFLRHCAGEGVQRELLLRADALERAQRHRARDDTPLELLGLQLYVDGDLAEARELLLGELERGRRRGYLEHESFATLLLGELEVRAGRWSLAETYARQSLELSVGTDLWNAEAGGHWIVALVEAHLGRVESACEHAEAGRRQATQLGDLVFATRCSHALGFVALSQGDATAAVRHLAPLPEAEARMGLREPAMFCLGPDLAEALVLAGDLEAAGEVQADLERRGEELQRPWAIAAALRCRGLIAAAEGRPDTALAPLHEAVALHAEIPQPFDRARTLLVLGATQRRAKQRAEARGSLDAARAIFEELGAPLWAERARAEIARLGGRRARDRDELTETERRIAELAAEGRSNREIAGELFVSERTVEANLTRAYRKLGVRSRTELARRMPAD